MIDDSMVGRCDGVPFDLHLLLYYCIIQTIVYSRPAPKLAKPLSKNIYSSSNTLVHTVLYDVLYDTPLRALRVRYDTDMIGTLATTPYILASSRLTGKPKKLYVIRSFYVGGTVTTDTIRRPRAIHSR